MANPNPPPPPVANQFKPGQSGNPLGRHNPAKRLAGEAAWKALRDDFEVNGVQAIIDMREKKPEAYVALVASGLPAEKAIDLTVKRLESLTEEQSRLMAEEIIERHKRRLASAGEPAGVHDSVPAGLPAGAVTSEDR